MEARISTSNERECPISMPSSQEQLTVYLPAELKEDLKQWADAEDRSMNYLVVKAIAAAVNKWKQSKEEAD